MRFNEVELLFSSTRGCESELCQGETRMREGGSLGHCQVEALAGRV